MHSKGGDTENQYQWMPMRRLRTMACLILILIVLVVSTYNFIHTIPFCLTSYYCIVGSFNVFLLQEAR